MSKEMGPLSFGKKEEQIFLGREISQHRDYSEATANQIDAEVKKMIVEANDKVFSLLREDMPALKEMSELLLEKETITSEDLRVILDKHGIAVENPAPAPRGQKDTSAESSTVATPDVAGPDEADPLNAPAEEESVEGKE